MNKKEHHWHFPSETHPPRGYPYTWGTLPKRLNGKLCIVKGVDFLGWRVEIKVKIKKVEPCRIIIDKFQKPWLRNLFEIVEVESGEIYSCLELSN